MFTLILVDYNALERTIEYTRLSKQYLGYEGASHVVIVENGTPEEPLEVLSTAFGQAEEYHCSEVKKKIYRFQFDGQEILYCNSGSNLGYAQGNNLGAMIASCTWNDEYYIISNNDLVFREKLDLALVTCMLEADPNIGVIGPRVVTPGGEQQSPRFWQSAGKRLIGTYWIAAFGRLFGQKVRDNLWNNYCNDTIKDAQSGFCAWVSGCFMFVRAEAFHIVGMFDEHTFLYAEEMILSKRMEEKGYGVYFCGEVEVIHNHAQTTKNHLSALRMSRIDFESNCYFYHTYMGASKVLLSLAKASYELVTLLLKVKHKLKAL